MILLMIGAMSGLLFGMHIGGNYFVNFEFANVRGYEAVGLLGAITGSVLGLLVGTYIGVKFAEKHK